MPDQREPLAPPPTWDPNDFETIDFDTVDKDDLTKYIKWCTEAYEYEGWHDSELWGMFQEQFEKFTEEAFEKANRHYVGKLKSYLRSHGVYVEASRTTRMAKGLYNAAQEEEQAIWPQDQLRSQIETGPFHSILAKQAATTTSMAPQPVQPATKNVDTSTPISTSIPTAPQLPPQAARTSETSARASALSGLGREVANLAKLYTEEHKYSGENDNFEYKLNIFNNACKRADIPAEGKADAFPTMLKGLALDFYFSTLDNRNLNFDQMCEAMIVHFEGEEYQRATQAKWDSTTLSSVARKHEGQSTEECLQLLLQELTHLRHGLEPACRSDNYFRNKLISACRGVPACELACFTPSPTISGFIHQLKSSISTYEHTHNPTLPTNTIMFTDRRYYRQDDRSDQRTKGGGTKLNNNS